MGNPAGETPPFPTNRPMPVGCARPAAPHGEGETPLLPTRRPAASGYARPAAPCPAGEALDAIPNESFLETTGPDESGMVKQRFLAFNTLVTLQAFGDERACLAAFDVARSASRRFERLFSRTLTHSDIARLNAAGGDAVEVAPETADLLERALFYCADSCGRFDVTMGAAVRLWDLRRGIVPSRDALDEALEHVDWRGMHVWREDGHAFAQLDDPLAAVDVGGIAKGWIADELTRIMRAHGLSDFIVNLGGNVVAHGEKPGGVPWNIGIQDPRDKGALVGAMPLRDASAVTSGIYERCCTVGGRFYHHILSPETGMPAQTDAAGVTVVADRSIGAEGYSTTLLALGIERGCAFARERPTIRRAIFVDRAGHVVEA